MASYGSAAAPVYGFQAAKNTTAYPNTAGLSAPTVSKTTTPATNPYAAQVAKNTTAYPSAPPLSQPTKTISPTPAATPSSAAPAPATQAVAAPSQLYDYTTDPVLQQVQAQSAAAQQQAEADALAAQKQLAIQYSDPAYAATLGDTATQQAAAANPYGVYALLNYQQPLDAQALDETENKNNLFYSGDRVVQQGQLANSYGQKRSDAATAEQQAEQQIQATRLSALLAAQQAVTSAQGDAYNRYLQQLLANPAAIAAPVDTTTDTTPVAPVTPLTGAYAPYAVASPANPTGLSANKKQGVFAIH